MTISTTQPFTLAASSGSSSTYAVEQAREEVAKLIASTVAAWDANATSRKIELQIGRDLQFIRINGTIVGGMVGVLLHVIAVYV